MTLKKKLLVGSGGLMLSGFLVFIAGSLSWFTDYVSLNPDQIQGSTLGTYFAYGDGTKDKPYGINTPRHLYNLSWLQYMGEFNQTTDSSTGKLQSYYFEIDSSISKLDMTGWTIPPIGTEEYPFIGTFNGNNVVISNLTISNTFSDYNAHPYKYDEESFYSPKIIGFFGIVGKYNGNIEYTSETNSVSRLYLDDFIVKNNSATNVLAGFLAGYVNGEMEYCGVHYAHFEFKNGTSNLADTDPNFDKVSKFTLIGAYDTDNFSLSGDPNGGGGQIDDFGGSIEFLSLRKRMVYMAGSNQMTDITKSGFKYTFSSDTYNFHTTYSLGPLRDYTSTGDVPFLKNSYLPLNIDLTTMNNEMTQSKKISGSSYTFKTTDYYNSTNTEAALSTNTGYLTGSGNSNTLVFSSLISNLDSSLTVSTKVKDDKQVEWIYPTCIDVSTGATTSSENYSKYEKVVSELNESIDYTNSRAYGIRWYPSKTELTSSDVVSVTNDDVTMVKQSGFSSYQNFLKGSLDFFVEKAGVITCVTSSTVDGSKPFALYSISRNSSGSISDVTLINSIYKNGNNYTINGDSGTKVYSDLSNLSVPNKSTYYFEIQVPAGEYAISYPVTSSSTSTYFMYLDIGANASSEEDTRTELSKIDFVYKDSGTIVKIDDNSFNPSNVLISIDGKETGDGKYYFRRVSQTVGVLWYVNTASMAVENISTASGTFTKAGDENCNS